MYSSDLTATTIADAFVAFHDLTPDGFMMFRPVRSDDGKITDLEWTFVNKSASNIIGVAPEELVGKRLLVEMPGNRDEGLFDAYVSVIETGDTWQGEFFYDHGGISAWFRTTATKAGDGLALSFADITDIRKGDERLRNLIDGVLAFIGVLSLDGILLEANEHAVAAAGGDREQLIGRPFWDCYWWDVNQSVKDRLKDAVALAAKGERVRYDTEIQVAGGQRLWIDFQIVPVVDSAGRVKELIPSGVDITERIQSAAHRELLIGELSHRVKNTLASIQSIARQTIRSESSMKDFRISFSDRLQAIAASHDLLVEFDHKAVPLTALVRSQIDPYLSMDHKLHLSGEEFQIPGDVAHTLGLILHELAVNAAKYGALSVSTGEVAVSWQVSPAKDPETRSICFEWVERGGPEVRAPTRQGFGTKLIEHSLASGEGTAQLDYDVQGFSCRLELTL